MTAAAAQGRSRLIGSDVLRALATVGVILIHASAWGPSAPYASVNLVARFSVPVFAVLTGLLLGYQYRDRARGLDFARRRLSRSVLPWLVWAPIYLLLNAYLFGSMKFTGTSLSLFWAEGAGHLWYLLLVPQLYALFLVWPRRGVWPLAVGAMVLQTALCVWRTYGPLPGGVIETLSLQYSFLLFPYWIGYFGVGVAIGQTWRPLGTRVRVTAAILGPFAIVASAYLLLQDDFAGAKWQGFVQGTGAFQNPVLPAFVFSIVVWFIAIGPAVVKRSRAVAAVVRPLSDLSLGVYILHPIFVYLAGRVVGHALGGSMAVSALVFSAIVLVALVASLILTRLIAATPLAFTVGMRQQPLQRDVAVLALRARDALLLRHVQRVDQH